MREPKSDCPPSVLETRVLTLCREAIHPTIELDTLLLQEGILDSFQALDLMGRFEREFNVQLNLDEVTEADLESPRAIADLVERAATRE
jgi:acyl carrier protein